MGSRDPEIASQDVVGDRSGKGREDTLTVTGLLIATACLYFLGWYAAAFWVIVAAIVNGSLTVIRAVVDLDWFYRDRARYGVDESSPITRAQHVRNLVMLVVGVLMTAALIFVELHVGRLAGYASIGP